MKTTNTQTNDRLIYAKIAKSGDKTIIKRCIKNLEYQKEFRSLSDQEETSLMDLKTSLYLQEPIDFFGILELIK